MQTKQNNLEDQTKDESMASLIQEARMKLLSIVSSEFFSERLKAYLTPMQEEGPPFIEYEAEPRQVRQIKDVINALYHAGIVASKMDSKWDTVSNVGLIYHSAVKAAHHLTYLDLDIMEVFGGEIQLLIQQLTKVSAVLSKHGEDIENFAEKAAESISSYKVGQVIGTAVNQLDPKQKSPDYEFLTQFSASLPGYIQQLTNSIQEYSQKVEAIQPHLNKERIEGLKEGALDLVNTINVIQQSSGILLPFHLLHYIAILKQVATFAMATFEEIGLMNHASQNLIAENIYTLKLELLPKLISEVDKVEDQCLLQPGTLSKPLMQQITGLYSHLIHYAGIVIDFSTRDEGLRQLEDQVFKEKRIQHTKNRILETKTKLHVTELTMQDFETFFSLIHKPNNANKKLIDFDKRTKIRLIEAYHSLQAFVEKLSPELHNKIVHGLTEESSKVVAKKQISEEKQEEHAPESTGWFQSAYNWWNGANTVKTNLDPNGKDKDDDSEEEVENLGWGIYSTAQSWISWAVGDLINWKELENNLKPIIQREIATSAFHITLNQDLIQKMDSVIPSALSPYAEGDPFLVDEKAVLTQNGMIESTYVFSEENGFCFVKNVNLLQASQAIHLAIVYEDKELKLQEAKAAYLTFVSKIKTLLVNPDSDFAMRPLKQAYLTFQPWIVSQIKGSIEEQAQVDFLNAAAINVDLKTVFGPLLDIETYYVEKFDTALAFYAAKKNDYFVLGSEKLQSTPLVLSEKDVSRSNFLLKHSKYSEAISILRTQLNSFMDIFSEEIRLELQMKSLDAAPFKTLETKNGRMAEPKQLIGIKAVFKMLYHLEQSIRQFEKLDTTSYQPNFLRHLAGVQSHALELYNLAKILYEDPHAGKIYNEFLEMVMHLKEVLMNSTAPYLENSDEAVFKPASNPLWLATQTFLLVPEQIKAAEAGRPLTDTEKTKVKEETIRIVQNVERIIGEADSYFKLFLEIPTFYNLFNEFRAKLAVSAGLSHGFVLNHLSDIYGVMNKLLIEADKMERNFGLKPGYLSFVLQEVFDQFYAGLLEPLNLNSRQHLDLLTTDKPLYDRKKITSAFHQNAWMEVEDLSMTVDNLSQLLLLMQLHSDDFYEENYLQLQRLFLEMLPYLEPNSPEVEAEGAITKAELPMNDFDTFVQDGLNLEKPISQVFLRVESALADYKGRLATLKFTMNSVDAQRKYLEQLIEDKQVQNEILIVKYTEKALTKQQDVAVEALSGSFVYYTDEYKKTFKKTINLDRNAFIHKVKNAPDIQQAIANHLQQQLINFNLAEYASYKQLDDCMTALDGFEKYLAKAEEEMDAGSTLFFEDSETIRAKRVVIRELKNMAMDGSPPQIRLISLQNALLEQEETLTTYKEYEKGSFYWLMQCIVSLLEAIHLYTPESKSYYLLATDKARLTEVDDSNWAMPFQENFDSLFADTENLEETYLDNSEEPFLPTEKLKMDSSYLNGFTLFEKCASSSDSDSEIYYDLSSEESIIELK